MATESREDDDHYLVLGLPTGEDGANLTLDQIEKAYKTQSRLRHPDKRPDDPNATADFQLLRSSYDVLRDEASRRAFDARLRARREKLLRDASRDTKRQKLASDLEHRERAAATREADLNPEERARQHEKQVASKLEKELADFQARNSTKYSSNTSTGRHTSTTTEGRSGAAKDNGNVVLEKEKMLKVTWEKSLGDYSAASLKELFTVFGKVEDIVIKSKKTKGSAIVVMSSKEAAEAAVDNLSITGSISNPLLVMPLQANAAREATISNTVGAAFSDYEASIMKKLQEANKRKQGQME